MRGAYRGLIACSAIGGLCWAAWATSAQSIAANALYLIDRETSTWSPKEPPSAGDTTRIAKDLRSVVARAPGNPAARDLLGTALMLTSKQTQTQTQTKTQTQTQAEAQFKASLELRPTSGYTWANYLVSGYSLGLSADQLEPRIRNAALLGPHEDAVQRIVTDYGLALWPQLSGGGKAAVEAMLVRGSRRNPTEMLQIASRRGRLDVACRQLIFRTIKPCLGMEATS